MKRFCWGDFVENFGWKFSLKYKNITFLKKKVLKFLWRYHLMGLTER
jgi:hypothetical protein